MRGTKNSACPSYWDRHEELLVEQRMPLPMLGAVLASKTGVQLGPLQIGK